MYSDLEKRPRGRGWGLPLFLLENITKRPRLGQERLLFPSPLFGVGKDPPPFKGLLKTITVVKP